MEKPLKNQGFVFVVLPGVTLRCRVENYSHSMVNELVKRLIFQCFPDHSVADTLKNTLTSKTRHCQFVAGARGEESPLTHSGHQILLGDAAFISAHQQSQRSDEFKDTPILSATLSSCH